MRPSPSGTSVVVSEMPSAASRYGILATDAAEAWMPCVSRPCIGLAPGRERLALPPAVRRVAGALAVDDVRGDGQDRLGVEGVAIGRVLPQLAHERA